MAVIYLIVIHFYIAYMEEKYLEKLFEKEYSIYKRKTPRYIGRLNQIKNDVNIFSLKKLGYEE